MEAWRQPGSNFPETLASSRCRAVFVLERLVPPCLPEPSAQRCAIEPLSMTRSKSCLWRTSKVHRLRHHWPDILQDMCGNLSLRTMQAGTQWQTRRTGRSGTRHLRHLGSGHHTSVPEMAIQTKNLMLPCQQGGLCPRLPATVAALAWAYVASLQGCLQKVGCFGQVQSPKSGHLQ